ncbi:hypothetical protein DBB_49450 [Desulfoluna spongiiphila]|nr:hypothetical protein DBB_49450 [Desulfoluna spongiiphila]
MGEEPVGMDVNCIVTHQRNVDCRAQQSLIPLYKKNSI